MKWMCLLPLSLQRRKFFVSHRHNGAEQKVKFSLSLSLIKSILHISLPFLCSSFDSKRESITKICTNDKNYHNKSQTNRAAWKATIPSSNLPTFYFFMYQLALFDIICGRHTTEYFFLVGRLVSQLSGFQCRKDKLNHNMQIYKQYWNKLDRINKVCFKSSQRLFNYRIQAMAEKNKKAIPIIWNRKDRLKIYEHDFNSLNMKKFAMIVSSINHG